MGGEDREYGENVGEHREHGPKGKDKKGKKKYRVVDAVAADGGVRQLFRVLSPVSVALVADGWSLHEEYPFELPIIGGVMPLRRFAKGFYVLEEQVDYLHYGAGDEVIHAFTFIEDTISADPPNPHWSLNQLEAGVLFDDVIGAVNVLEAIRTPYGALVTPEPEPKEPGDFLRWVGTTHTVEAELAARGYWDATGSKEPRPWPIPGTGLVAQMRTFQGPSDEIYENADHYGYWETTETTTGEPRREWYVLTGFWSLGLGEAWHWDENVQPNLYPGDPSTGGYSFPFQLGWVEVRG